MIKKDDSSLTAYLLLMAMGFHAFFEGVAMGVGNNVFVYNLFIAIVTHKWSEAMIVGISFVRAGIETKKSIKFITIFCLFTPIGILVGIYLSGASEWV